MDEHVEDEVEIPTKPPRRLKFAAISYNNGTFDNLVLREPTAGDVLEAQKKLNPIDQALTLIQRVSKLPMQVVLQLPQAVLEAAGAYFEPFSEPSPGMTGEA